EVRGDATGERCALARRKLWEGADLLPAPTRSSAGSGCFTAQLSQGLHPAEDSEGGARGADVRRGAERGAPPKALRSLGAHTASASGSATTVGVVSKSRRVP